MEVNAFWIAVLAAALGASVPAALGFTFQEMRQRRARSRDRGQALSDLANALAENMRIVLRIPDEIRQQRAPANLLLADGWMHAASRVASRREDLTADFRIFFEECKRLNEFLEKFDALVRTFNLEDNPHKQRALQRMLQDVADNTVKLCGNLLKNGKHLMEEIKRDPAWQRLHKSTEKERGSTGSRSSAFSDSA